MRKKILLVDDNYSLLETMSKLLITEGFFVENVTSANKALRLLNEKNFDLLISDICMPGIDGIELIKRIKKTLGKKIPIIFMTANADVDIAKTAIKLGVSDFITKPFSSDEMLKAIKEQLFTENLKETQVPLNDFTEKKEYVLYFTLNDYLKYDIPLIISNYIMRELNLSSKYTNNLFLCLEEIISNAFLHGLLGLSSDFISQNEDQLEKILINESKKKEIIDNKVKVTLCIGSYGKKIDIQVSDNGNGFDYENFLNKPKLDECLFNNFKSSGRGLDIISLFFDEIVFSNKGSTISVSKYFINE